MTTPTPAIFAKQKAPLPEPLKPRPVKRRRGLESHVDQSTLTALRKLSHKSGRRR